MITSSIQTVRELTERLTIYVEETIQRDTDRLVVESNQLQETSINTIDAFEKAYRKRFMRFDIMSDIS
jgi:hypothetical protein